MARLSSFSGQTPAAKAQIYTLFKTIDKSTILALLPALADLDYRAVLSNRPLPWLLIQGHADRDINRALASTLSVHQANPSNQLVQLSKAGHFANLDQPNIFHQTLHTFFQKF